MGSHKIVHSPPRAPAGRLLAAGREGLGATAELSQYSSVRRLPAGRENGDSRPTET